MVGLEVTVLFLVVPAGAWAVGAVLVGNAYSELRTRGLPVVSAGSPGGRVVVYFAITAANVVFGLLLWFLIAGLEEEFGPLATAEMSVVRWMGLGFSLTISTAIGSAAWTARIRIAQLAGEEFGRALPLLVVWTTSVILGLFVNFLAVARMSSILEVPSSLRAAQEAQLVAATLGYAITTLGAPFAAILSARVPDLSSPREFTRAIARTEVGTVPAILGLVWAVFQIGGV